MNDTKTRNEEEANDCALGINLSKQYIKRVLFDNSRKIQFSNYDKNFYAVYIINSDG